MLLLFSHPVMSDSLWPGLQHTRPPCPLPSPRVCPSLWSLHQWCCPAISSSVSLFSFCPQSLAASATFPMSQLFASDDKITGPSASASVLPMSIWGWFLLRLTGFLSLLSKELSGSSPAPQFEGINSLMFCLLYGPTLTIKCDHWEDHSLDYFFYQGWNSCPLNCKVDS